MIVVIPVFRKHCIRNTMCILVEEFYSKKEGFYIYPLFFFHANLLTGSGGEEVAAGPGGGGWSGDTWTAEKEPSDS